MEAIESKPSTEAVEDPAALAQVNLKVMDSSGNATQFKIKSHTALKKLMSTYCERAGLDFQSVRFTFDGQRVNGSDTAQSLGMEEGDAIEVFQEQQGGQELGKEQQGGQEMGKEYQGGQEMFKEY